MADVTQERRGIPHAGKKSPIGDRPTITIEILVRGDQKVVTLQGTEFRTSLDGTLHIYSGPKIIRSFNVHYWLDVKEKK